MNLRFGSFVLSASLIIISISLSACSQTTTSLPEISNSNWQSNGSIALSRAVPAVSVVSPSRMLGFLPATPLAIGNWLKIDSKQGTLNMMSGDKSTNILKVLGSQNLSPGVYEVKMKQRDPVWYAPDSYFQSRMLTVPANGAKERYRKGAMGSFALFIDKTTAIHSSPVWSEEVGGIQLDEKELSRLYYSLEVGSLVQIE